MLVIFLVGLVGFGIGRLSVLGQGSGAGELRVESTPVPVENVVEAIQGRGEEAQIGDSSTPTNVVGNKNSMIFHLSTCSGAKNMSDANKVYFSSVGAAVAAGFRAAGNCPGL